VYVVDLFVGYGEYFEWVVVVQVGLRGEWRVF